MNVVSGFALVGSAFGLAISGKDKTKGRVLIVASAMCVQNVGNSLGSNTELNGRGGNNHSGPPRNIFRGPKLSCLEPRVRRG